MTDHNRQKIINLLCNCSGATSHDPQGAWKETSNTSDVKGSEQPKDGEKK